MLITEQVSIQKDFSFLDLFSSPWKIIVSNWLSVRLTKSLRRLVGTSANTPPELVV